MLLGLAAAGLVVRLMTGGGEAPGGVLYRSMGGERPARDSVAARAARLARPLASGEKIDVDRARAEELTRLPRIGPALAARIVADRAANGPFGSPGGLDRVPGVGPTVLDGIRPHVVFSGRPRPGPKSAVRRRVILNTATAEELSQLPGIGPALAARIVVDRRERGPYRSLEDLARVRGIGPNKVEGLRTLVVVP